jgi:hypothetical protein
MEPIIIKAGPVDYGEKLAKMGEEKKDGNRKSKATVKAVIPVRPLFGNTMSVFTTSVCFRWMHCLHR